MIIQTKTGVLISGEIAKDLEIRAAGQKQVLSFDIKAHSVKDESGKRNSTYVQVNLWRGIDQWDGMLCKGDQVVVTARELKSREYNGKTYYSVDADAIIPDGAVTFRWMQQIVDMIPAGQPDQMQPTEEATPFDPPPVQPMQTSLDGGQMYSGERLSDYAPQRPAPAVGTPEADALINDDADDLPF